MTKKCIASRVYRNMAIVLAHHLMVDFLFVKAFTKITLTFSLPSSSGIADELPLLQNATGAHSLSYTHGETKTCQKCRNKLVLHLQLYRI